MVLCTGSFHPIQLWLASHGSCTPTHMLCSGCKNQRSHSNTKVTEEMVRSLILSAKERELQKGRNGKEARHRKKETASGKAGNIWYLPATWEDQAARYKLLLKEVPVSQGGGSRSEVRILLETPLLPLPSALCPSPRLLGHQDDLWGCRTPRNVPKRLPVGAVAWNKAREKETQLPCRIMKHCH